MYTVKSSAADDWLISITVEIVVFVAVVSASVLWCCWLADRKSIQPVKTLHQNPLATVVDISGWDTGWSTLWQAHLPVNATKGATGLTRFAWKMAVKTVCVCVFRCRHRRLLSLLLLQLQPQLKVKGKGKGRVLAIALLTRQHVTRSALRSRKWQLIGMS